MTLTIQQLHVTFLIGKGSLNKTKQRKVASLDNSLESEKAESVKPVSYDSTDDLELVQLHAKTSSEKPKKHNLCLSLYRNEMTNTFGGYSTKDDFQDVRRTEHL